MIAGTGTYATAHSVHLTARAHELGVHAFLVVTPYYNKPPPRGIVEHFKAIADGSDRPIVVYNIPGRVVLNLEPETIAELAEIPTVAAVKQANDDLDQARRDRGARPRPLCRRRQPDLPVPPPRRRRRHLRAHARRRAAGEGAVSAFRDGDEETARRIDEELEPIYELLKVAPNPIAIKAALNMLGLEVGGHRLPLVAATDEEVSRVRDCLERAGLQVPAPA